MCCITFVTRKIASAITHSRARVLDFPRSRNEHGPHHRPACRSAGPSQARPRCVWAVEQRRSAILRRHSGTTAAVDGPGAAGGQAPRRILRGGPQTLVKLCSVWRWAAAGMPRPAALCETRCIVWRIRDGYNTEPRLPSARQRPRVGLGVVEHVCLFFPYLRLVSVQHAVASTALGGAWRQQPNRRLARPVPARAA